MIRVAEINFNNNNGLVLTTYKNLKISQPIGLPCLAHKDLGIDTVLGNINQYSIFKVLLTSLKVGDLKLIIQLLTMKVEYSHPSMLDD